MKKQGIHKISAANYHADPCVGPSLSSSVAKILYARSPRHAFLAHPRLNKNYTAFKPSSNMTLGTAAHRVVLDDTLDNIVLVEADSWRTNAAKDTRDAALANGKIPLLPPDYELLEPMWDAMKETSAGFPYVGDAFRAGLTERSFIWSDCLKTFGEGGIRESEKVWFRARPDIYWAMKLHGGDGSIEAPGLIYDYKTTALPATAEGWGRNQIWEYAMQVGHYRRGFCAVHDIDIPPRFIFVVQETTPPHGVALFELDAEGLAFCDRIAASAARRWIYSVLTDKWPSYLLGINVVATPGWIHSF